MVPDGIPEYLTHNLELIVNTDFLPKYISWLSLAPSRGFDFSERSEIFKKPKSFVFVKDQ